MLAERVGFEPKLSNEINTLGGANGTSNLHNSSFLPPSAETPILLIGPAIGIIVLLALPFVAGEGEKSWKRRPIAVLTITLVAVSLGTLTHLV
jgi:hypothetical protein